MAYPFGSKEYRKFDNTFLIRTIFKVSYKMPDCDGYAVFNSFFEKALGITVSRERYDLIGDNVLALDSEDDDIHWLFDGQSITRIVEYPKYENYAASMAESVKNVAVLMRKLNAAVENVSVRKIDLFAFDGETPDDADGFARFIFRKDFISEVWNSDEYMKDETSLMKSRVFSDEATDDRVRFVTGYIMEPNKADGEDDNKQPSRLVLDCTATANGGSGTIEEVAERLNSTAFDAFMWAVDDPVVKLMEGKKDV